MALGELERHSEALESFREALKIREATLGENDPLVADSHDHVGIGLANLTKYKEALEEFNKARAIYQFESEDLNKRVQMANEIEVREALQKHEGEALLCLATVQHHIGICFEISGDDYPRALMASNRALEIRKKFLGEEHLDTANSYAHRATLLLCLMDYKKAKESILSSLKIRREQLGDNHVITAESYAVLGDIQEKSETGEKTLKEALENQERALAIRKDKLGEKHQETVNSYVKVAILLGKLNRHDEALSHAKMALTNRGGKLVPTKNLVENYNVIGIEYYALQNYKEAFEKITWACHYALLLCNNEKNQPLLIECLKNLNLVITEVSNVHNDSGSTVYQLSAELLGEDHPQVKELQSHLKGDNCSIM